MEIDFESNIDLDMEDYIKVEVRFKVEFQVSLKIISEILGVSKSQTDLQKAHQTSNRDRRTVSPNMRIVNWRGNVYVGYCRDG